MRGSVAKRLRRITQHGTSSIPTYTKRTTMRRAAVPTTVNPSGFILISRVTRVLVTDSSRAAYQRAKKLFRVVRGSFAKHIFAVGI